MCLLLGGVFVAVGCGRRYDPIVDKGEQRLIRTAAIVTSRVVKSSEYVNTAEHGVAVYSETFKSSRLGGPLLAAGGRRRDEEAARRLNDALGDYDFEEVLAEDFYEALSQKAIYTVIAKDEVDELYMPEVLYGIEGEIVRRKKDYPALARALGADVVIDLRVVEWALVFMPASDDVKLRLRLRVKIIKYPENKTLYFNEIVNDPDTRSLGYTVDRYRADHATALKSSTAEAMDAVITKILREIVE